MLKNYLSILIGVVLIFSSTSFASEIENLHLNQDDRILVLGPHPDDEVLGVGGVLQQAVDMKLPLKVVFLTYGDSNPWSFLLYRKHPVVMPGAVKKMGMVRREEAEVASQILGVGKNNLVFLGYPDFGTMNIWYTHWNDRVPLRGMMTQANNVPYQGALRPGALYKGEEIVKDLRTIISDFKPTKIFISHPTDHNGDHLALYLFTRVALWDENLDEAVKVYPFLIHYLGWPKPKGFHPDKELAPPSALTQSIQWSKFDLSDKQIVIKKKALEAHQSQYKSSKKYLLSFIRKNELFGDFPTIRLHLNEESSVFQMSRSIVSNIELPDDFNAREKNSFVGVNWKFVRWEGEELIISIELSKPLAQDVEASVYIFGYNKNMPFGQMPKINVRLGVLSYNVYDQNKRLEQSVIKIKRSSTDITIHVPMAVLGDPDRILTSARTYLGNVPLDNSSWVAVKFE